MAALRHVLAFLPVALLCAGCHHQEVANYRVPKEADPTLPGLSADASGGQPSGGASMAGTAVPTDSGPSLSWTAPGAWQAKSASAMEKGSYTVPGSGGQAASLSITAFPGDVGGELANVNRWRGQVGLQPLGDADLAGAVPTISQNGLTFEVVDCARSGPNRILAAIVPYADGTWFFKMMGPDALVEGQKTAFLAFLKTVKPAAHS